MMCLYPPQVVFYLAFVETWTYQSTLREKNISLSDVKDIECILF